MTWFWYAFAASALWGLKYLANQFLLKHFSILEVIFYESIFMILVISPWFFTHIHLRSIIIKFADIKILTIAITACLISLTAITFIYKSIVLSNATLAALIESSYPAFTMFFAFILLGQVQFNFYTLIGGILIIAGLVLINSYGQA